MRRLLWQGLVVCLVALFVGWTLFPLFWLVSNAFKVGLAAYEMPPRWIPDPFTWENVRNLWTGDVPFTRFFANSLIACSLTALLATLLATMSAYVFSRFRFRGSRGLMTLILGTQMFPLVVLLIPLYVVFRQLHLLNTYTGLVLGFTTFALPFAVWMMKGFIDAVPQEIDQAAMIDGCSRGQAMLRVVVPLVSPGLMVVFLFGFLEGWNNLLFPMTLTNTIEMKTVPPGMIYAFLGQYKQDWAGMMAASLVVSVPIFLVFLFLQRFLVEGLTGGAVKG